MSGLKKAASYRALQTNFELACIFGILVILADMTWLAHDIAANGFSIVYGIVGSLMLIGLTGTIVVVIRHNRDMVHKATHQKMVDKLRRLSKKHKIMGISHNPREEQKK